MAARPIKFKVVERESRTLIGYEWTTSEKGWQHQAHTGVSEMDAEVFEGTFDDYIKAPGTYDRYQFTGVFTPGKAEVYEGDIVRHLESIGVVEYPYGSFIVRWLKDPNGFNPVLISHCQEIIGNVYSDTFNTFELN